MPDEAKPSLEMRVMRLETSVAMLARADYLVLRASLAATDQDTKSLHSVLDELAALHSKMMDLIEVGE